MSRRDEVLLSSAPHAHMRGMAFCFSALYAGQTLVLFSEHRREMLVPAIREYKVRGGWGVGFVSFLVF